MKPFSNRKIELYVKQKGLCFICNKPFNEQELVNNKTNIHYMSSISKSNNPNSDNNLALVHQLCHKTLNH